MPSFVTCKSGRRGQSATSGRVTLSDMRNPYGILPIGVAALGDGLKAGDLGKPTIEEDQAGSNARALACEILQSKHVGGSYLDPDA